MWSTLKVDAASEVPLYRQLYEQIANAIRQGVVAHGERLPPTRELAGQLGLNRTTVSAAYELLEGAGLIEGHVGRGSFVAFPAGKSNNPISFESSQPAAEDIPMDALEECWREVMHRPDAVRLLQLGTPAGYAPLRSYLLSQAREDGSARAGDDLVITNGCQQALDLIQRVLAPPGSTVLVEDPVYHGLKNVFSRTGVRLLGFSSIADLKGALASEPVTLLLITPDFQNPTGRTLSSDERRQVVALAREHGVTLIENGIYSELRYSGEPLPTLKQLDETGSTVLIRSFSKMAFPGLRVGWVLAPAKLAAQISHAKHWCDLHTDQLSQALLLRFAESGRLAAHLTRVRAHGRERLEAVLQACERHLPPGTTYTRPQGGMNLWIELPDGVDASDLLADVQKLGVNYLPGRHFSVSRYEPGTLRLSFGALPPARIESGVRTLGRAIEARMAQAVPALV